MYPLAAARVGGAGPKGAEGSAKQSALQLTPRAIRSGAACLRSDLIHVPIRRQFVDSFDFFIQNCVNIRPMPDLSGARAGWDPCLS